MDLSQSTLSILALTGVGLAALALLYAVVVGRRIRRVRGRPPRGAAAPSRATNGTGQHDLDLLRDELTYAIQRVGLVRFDAFEEMGGHLSFAAAFLDGEGSGIVLSSINGRNDTRIYAKQIERGASRHNLSDEEAEAIRRALGGVRA